MIKDVKKSKQILDYFTETTIVFTIFSIEYRIKLAVYGIFQRENDKIIPVPLSYKIIQVKSSNKIIECSDKINKHVNNWIKNNPNKFSFFIATELSSIMSNPIQNKSKILKENPIDRQ